MDAAQWNAEIAKNSAITTEELDKLAAEYNEAWDKYTEKKDESSELYQKAQELEGKLVEALELAGKNKYYVEGIGTFSFSEKMSVKVPATIEDKQALARFLEEQGGKVLFWEKFTINSQTLQGLYKAMFEEFKEKCESEGKPEAAAMFNLPGVGAPTLMRSLKLTADRKGKKS